MRDVRLFARITADGSLRKAVRPVDQPGWQWIYASEDAQHIVGDVVLNVATVADLPKDGAGL